MIPERKTRAYMHNGAGVPFFLYFHYLKSFALCFNVHDIFFSSFEIRKEIVLTRSLFLVQLTVDSYFDGIKT